MKGLGASSQDNAIARFEAESRCVGGDVGPRFVDDSNDTDWNPHLPTIRPFGLFHILTTSPTGSARRATSRIPFAISPITAGVNLNRSIKAGKRNPFPLLPDPSHSPQSESPGSSPNDRPSRQGLILRIGGKPAQRVRSLLGLRRHLPDFSPKIDALLHSTTKSSRWITSSEYLYPKTVFNLFGSKTLDPFELRGAIVHKTPGEFFSPWADA